MKALIVEDDFVSRRLLQAILSPYGHCDIAVNGIEAIEAFKLAFEEGVPYDLVCLDIMMPEMNGHEVLKTVRDYEIAMGKIGLDCAKVIMTTALSDFENIKSAFIEQCEAYLVKPIQKAKLLSVLENLELIHQTK
ncbi:MAG: response regulator [Clostridia bacterium]|nr:response regulator [Clostridia bacterium]